MNTDELEQELVRLECHIGRVRARQLDLLAEVDRRQTPLADGCRTLSEWVCSRVDVAPETGRVLSRMVHTTPPAVIEELTAGGLSFDRACELVRLEDPTASEIEGSKRFDIAGLRRLIARDRAMTPVEEHDAFSSRHFVMQPTLDQTSWRLWGSLPGHEGALVGKVLTDTADSFPSPPEGAVYTRAQRRADALVATCTGNPTGTGPGSVVSVFVDATTRSHLTAEVAAGPRVGPATLEKLLCDSSIEVTAIDTDGRPLGVGRRTAAIPPRLKRYVLWRDHGCVIDGCTSRYRLEPHHITPHSHGGVTDAANLAAVCWYHHHIVIHTLGYRLNPNSPPHRRRFLTPQPHPGPDP